MLVESQKMTANAQTMVSKTYNELKDVVVGLDPLVSPGSQFYLF